MQKLYGFKRGKIWRINFLWDSNFQGYVYFF